MHGNNWPFASISVLPEIKKATHRNHSPSGSQIFLKSFNNHRQHGYSWVTIMEVKQTLIGYFFQSVILEISQKLHVANINSNENLQLYSSKKVLHHLYYIHVFFKFFCKLLEKLPKFIDKTLQWWLLIEIVIKHASFYFSCYYNRGIKAMGVTELILQKSQLLKFN